MMYESLVHDVYDTVLTVQNHGVLILKCMNNLYNNNNNFDVIHLPLSIMV